MNVTRILCYREHQTEKRSHEPRVKIPGSIPPISFQLRDASGSQRKGPHPPANVGGGPAKEPRPQQSRSASCKGRQGWLGKAAPSWVLNCMSLSRDSGEQRMEGWRESHSRGGAHCPRGCRVNPPARRRAGKSALRLEAGEGRW